MTGLFEEIPLISMISLLLSILAIVIAALRWSATRQSSQLAAVQMYTDNNRAFLEFIETLNPIGPYTPIEGETAPSEREAVLRIFLLNRLNRFRFAASRREKRLHTRFRKQVMGSNLTEFASRIRERGGSGNLAQLASEVLVEIHEREPYFDRRFWRTYFRRFDWAPLETTYEPGINAESSGANPGDESDREAGKAAVGGGESSDA